MLLRLVVKRSTLMVKGRKLVGAFYETFYMRCIRISLKIKTKRVIEKSAKIPYWTSKYGWNIEKSQRQFVQTHYQ